MFPLEILRVLSLHLPPHTLAVSTQLTKMYDDQWYHDFLHHRHPELVLSPCPGYRELTKKYMESGNVYRVPFKTDNINCLSVGVEKLWGRWIKVGAMGNNEDILLNFTGDAFLNNTLLDTRVIDVDSYTYIKDFEWYIRDDYGWEENDKKWHKLNIRPDKPFIFTKFSPYGLCAITSDTHY